MDPGLADLIGPVVLLSLVTDGTILAVPQALIDDTPAFAHLITEVMR